MVENDLDGEQDADAPKSLRIPKTTNYTFEGGVNELPNPGTNDVWGQASGAEVHCSEGGLVLFRIDWSAIGSIFNIRIYSTTRIRLQQL